METGLVSNIQHYSLQDGPGIRTTVFLKGCPLRCRWCCNPETQAAEPEPMRGGITGRRMSVEEVLQEVEKDEIFFRRGGGGLTVSGGEPLLQGRFTLALLRESKKRDLLTAMESSACGETALLEELAVLLGDLFLDLKCLSPERHRRWTGRDNALILENIRRTALLPGRGRLTIRTPVIPGFNDTEEDIEDICRFLTGLSVPLSYELLPYHRLGRDKYGWLGREYPMGDVKLETGRIAVLREIVRQYGLDFNREEAERQWSSML